MMWVNPVQDHLVSVRPFVRYVDADQAVIDVRLNVTPPLPTEPSTHSTHPKKIPPQGVVASIELSGADGFCDEQVIPLKLEDHAGVIRFDVVQPQRWWPAGMGDQALYTLTVKLFLDNNLCKEHTATLGLTSVRRAAVDQQVELLVNGRVCEIQSIVPVDLADERSLLPASGDSLLIIRGHYGPDLLYDAADRAGILLIQCIPIDPDGSPQVRVAEQVDRLSSHPSLAGWFVGHLGDLSEPVGQRIRDLDPGRTVFHEVPALAQH